MAAKVTAEEFLHELLKKMLGEDQREALITVTYPLGDIVLAVRIAAVNEQEVH